MYGGDLEVFWRQRQAEMIGIQIVSPHTLSVTGFVRNSKYRRAEFSTAFPGAVIGLLKGLSVAEPTS